MTKLTSSEEVAIVCHVLDLDMCGFLPMKPMLYTMANKLLEVCGGNPIRVHWPDNFLRQTLDLKKCWTC